MPHQVAFFPPAPPVYKSRNQVIFSVPTMEYSSSCPMSPTRLRSDLYSFPCHGEPMSPAPPLVVSVLASLLDRHIARNERLVEEEKGGEVDARARGFESDRVLDMSTQAFLERFSRYTRVSPAVYVVAYVYLDRLCQANAGVRVAATNVHRLLTTAIVVASKFVEDMNYKNSYFAEVGGLRAAELNALELDFLFLVGFRLNVSASVYESYCRHLEREVSHGGGYQIERCLKAAFACAGDLTSAERGERQRKQQQQLLNRVL